MSLQVLFNSINNNVKNGIKLDKLKDLIYKYNSTDWKQFIKLNPVKYNRHIVFKNENVELLVVTWNKNQSTKIHGHPKNGCLFKILEGYIDEHKYENDDKTVINTFKQNDVGYIDNSIGYHKMVNDDNICVSLHIYSPPY